MKLPGENVGKWLLRNQKAHYYRRLRATRPDLARQEYLKERQLERGVSAQKK